jgi:transcriptional regulator with XRE-family HTH domain
MQDKLDSLPTYTAGMVHATRLRWYREQAVLTQKELADKAGLTVLSISKIEQGYQEPRPSTLRKLAKALRIKPQDLIDDDDADEDAVA